MILKGRVWPLRAGYMKTKTALFHQNAPAGTNGKAPIIGLGVLAGCSFWYLNSSKPIWSEPPKYPERQTHDANVEGLLSSLANGKSRIAVQDKSTLDLMISYSVYKACSLRWLTEVTPTLFSYAEALHLTRPLNYIVRHTIYNQFLGGETMQQCKVTMARMKNNGIGVILALSVETDVKEQDEQDKDTLSQHYNHKADETARITKDCILSASTQPGSFVAVKISALISPFLLQAVTNALSQLYRSFEEHASGQTMSQSLVCHVVAQHRGQVNVDENVLEIVHNCSCNDNDNEIDMVEFKHMLSLNFPAVLNLLSTFLTWQDKQDWVQMMRRLDEICSLAKSCGVKILIDAEQTYLQLAIDQAALVMEKRHNKLGACPTVYNTYQMYTKVATQKLERDLQAAERYGHGLGVKLVRGAYMRAAEEGYPDPIHDTLNDTHESYHGAIRLLLNRLRVAQDKTGEPVTEGNSPLSVVIASHNRESIIFACKELLDHNISFQCGVVFFGQLYGMCDSISYTLSAYGIPVFKYLPFGQIEQVIPYLIRRAQENSAILDRTTTECEIIKDELKHRLLGTHSSGEKKTGLI